MNGAVKRCPEDSVLNGSLPGSYQRQGAGEIHFQRDFFKNF